MKNGGTKIPEEKEIEKEKTFFEKLADEEVEEIKRIVKERMEEKAKNVKEDSDYITIKNILLKNWKEENKKLKEENLKKYTKEFEIFRLGWHYNTKEIFKKMAPEKYEWYKQNGIYDNPFKEDPVIIQLEREARENFSKKNSKKRYSLQSKEKYEEELKRLYCEFIKKYPTKAQAYKNEIPALRKAFEDIRKEE